MRRTSESQEVEDNWSLQERDEKAGVQKRNEVELDAGKERSVPKVHTRIHPCVWGFCISYGQSKQTSNHLQKMFKEMEVGL